MTVQQWQVHAYGPRGAQILGEVFALDRSHALARANARWPGRVLWVTAAEHLRAEPEPFIDLAALRVAW